MATNNLFVGARARFKINGNPFAFAGQTSGEESYDYEPIDILGLIEVAEYVVVGYRCGFNCQAFRIVGQSLKVQGIFPLLGNILTSGAIDAAIEDTVSQRTMYLFEEVKAAGKNFDISARSHMNENLSFNAIRCKDEAETPR